MFPKLNSRFSSLAALGIMVAVLGGCAESISGTDAASAPLPTRQEVVPVRLENEITRSTVGMPSTKVVAEPQRVAARHTVRLANEH
jgi:hypothetical protein